MKMPEEIPERMLAPCGINCAVCYKHVMRQKTAKPCGGCRVDSPGKPKHCLTCRIKTCVAQRGLQGCYECAELPCKLVKNLEKSYNKRYGVSLVHNLQTVAQHGVSAFLEQDRAVWMCACGGAISLHDGVCSECGEANRQVE